MNSALAKLLNTLASNLENALNIEDKDKGILEHSVTITIGNGGGNPGIQLRLDRNTNLTDPDILGAALSALVTRVVSLRSGDNPDSSVQIDILSEGNENQAARRTTLSIQRSTVMQEQDADAGLTISSECDSMADSAVRGIISRLMRALRESR